MSSEERAKQLFDALGFHCAWDDVHEAVAKHITGMIAATIQAAENDKLDEAAGKIGELAYVIDGEPMTIARVASFVRSLRHQPDEAPSLLPQGRA